MFDRADRAFARALAADDHEDATADALAARKAATSLVHALAQRRDDEDKAELTLLARSRPTARARRGAPDGARAWRSAYEALVAVSGWRFDVAYAPVAIERDRLETALAGRELRRGRSADLKALARRIVRVRSAETAAFRRS